MWRTRERGANTVVEMGGKLHRTLYEHGKPR